MNPSQLHEPATGRTDQNVAGPAEPNLDSKAMSTDKAQQDSEAKHRGPDRRQAPTPRLSRYTLWGGRRGKVRRDQEREGSFVDQYSWRLWALIAWVGAMNTCDSFFTIVHLQRGGIELNPVAALLLQTGRTGFVILKSVLIAVPLIVLCMHKNFFLARIGLIGAAVIYTALLAYHLYLL